MVMIILMAVSMSAPMTTPMPADVIEDRIVLARAILVILGQGSRKGDRSPAANAEQQAQKRRKQPQDQTGGATAAAPV